MAKDLNEKAGGSWLGLLLAACLALLVAVALAFLTLGWMSVAIVAAVCIFGFAALHYVTWGWWLARSMRDTEEAAAIDDQYARRPRRE